MEIKSYNPPEKLDEFVKFPFQLYKNTPYEKFWVPPLISETKKLFSNKNPFWKHAKIKIFLAQDNDKIVGRCAAIIDKNHIKVHNEKCGFFGFFDCINDVAVAKSLLDEAGKFLKSEGMEIIKGPANPSANDEYGLLIDGFDSLPVIMMTYNPPYYIDLIEKSGFKKAKDLYAFLRSTAGAAPERIAKIVERVKKREGVRFRNFDLKNFKRDVGYFKEIYNSAWEKNWGFVPMTDEEIDYMAKGLKPLLDPRICHFLEIKGEPVAATLSVPDYNFVLKKLGGRMNLPGIIKFFYWKRKIKLTRLMALGVKKEFRNKGLEAVLYHEIFISTKNAGYDAGELSWTLEDNDLINKGIEAMGGVLYKKYRIYESTL
ncbi:MAG TPA: N-acetyltransferase [Elusimicrobia bacterium]|nr:N-acetyltransferase [Elusimicrobiota bacterium]